MLFAFDPATERARYEARQAFLGRQAALRLEFAEGITFQPETTESVEDQAQYWWTFYNGRSPRGLKPANYMSRWALYCSGLYTDTPAPA